jgi:hypothetical protein
MPRQKAVTHSRLGEDVTRMGRVIADLATEPVDEDA